jgi:RNA polymerase sigma-70 factor (ECF subfamily)
MATVFWGEAGTEAGIFCDFLRFFCKFCALFGTNIPVMARFFDNISAFSTHSDDGSDEHLIKRFACGDGSAFDAIVEAYSGDVRSFADRMSGWNGDTEDIVQEVFLAAFLGLKKFKGKSSLRTWLYSIAINKCRAHRRKRMFRLKLFSSGYLDESAVESESMTREEFDSVGAAVRSLPLKYREVVVLRYLEELPTEKVCEILNVSSNVVHVRLNRARAMLKEKLSNLMDE